MANVNLRTGKIYGAEKCTKKYWHEVGHLKFEEQFKYGNLVRGIQDFSFRLLIFAIGFYVLLQYALLKVSIIILMLVNIFSEILEERWCWMYADYKLREKESDARIKRNKDKKI